MDVSVRSAVRSDIDALTTLIAQSVRSLSIGHYSQAQIERSLELVFGVDTQLIDDETYYVAQISDSIVGCGDWSKRSTMYGGDQAKSSVDVELDPRSSPARIRAFFIDPNYARKGVGSIILEHCEQAARLDGFISAELVATLPGVPFYVTRGYKRVEPVDIELRNGQTLPCIRMYKKLILG